MTDKKTLSLQRAIEAAIEAFSTQEYDKVLISDIAAKAHCSTATLYDAFGTKQEIYEVARQNLFLAQPRHTLLTLPQNRSRIDYLLDILKELFDGLTSPGVAILLSPTVDHASTYMPMEHTGPDFATLCETVEAYMQNGLLRESDPHAVTFMIYSGVSYEPILYHVARKEAVQLNFAAILRSVMIPIVTETGAEQLSDYLDKLDRPMLDVDGKPTLHELMHYGSLHSERRQKVETRIEEIREIAKRYVGRPKDFKASGSKQR